MGKRSDFKRISQDAYDTPREAVLPLLPFLTERTRFAEPCAGTGALIRHLEDFRHICELRSDIEPRAPGMRRLDILNLGRMHIDMATVVITNPPWRRDILHAIIMHMRHVGLPAWLLIDANWAFTAQAAPHLRHCKHIVTIGRVRWIPGTSMTGKDDCAWFYFHPGRVKVTRFTGKQTAGAVGTG